MNEKMYLILAITGALLVIIFSPPLLTMDFMETAVVTSQTNQTVKNLRYHSTSRRMEFELSPNNVYNISDLLYPENKKEYKVNFEIDVNSSVEFMVVYSSGGTSSGGTNLPVTTKTLTKGVNSFSITPSKNGKYYWIFKAGDEAASVNITRMEATYYKTISQTITRFSIYKGVLSPILVIVGITILLYVVYKIRKEIKELEEQGVRYAEGSTGGYQPRI